MHQVCVVHLIWAPLGTEPFRCFIESYREHPAGLAHRLLIAFNGFTASADLSAYTSLLAGIEYEALILPEPVQDIAAYFSAARASVEDNLCFLNSYSVILHDDWLAKLHAALQRDGVALVGATGNWESMYNNVLALYQPPPRWWTPHGLRTALNYRLALAQTRRAFVSFPNPHLRTNAFMLNRARLLAEERGAIRHKTDAFRFESGRDSLTARVLRAGAQVRVVDAQGGAWPPADWPASRTFRSGEQENLLISDNRTRDYAQADAATRSLLRSLAWGVADPDANRPC